MQGNKKGLLPKHGGSIGPTTSFKEPLSPLRCNIEVAKNGFTVRCSGGKDGYNDQPHVATDIDQALAIVAKHLGGKATAKEEKGE
jgi:hypothetical protein